MAKQNDETKHDGVEIADFAQRRAWKDWNKVQVYCQLQKRWFTGRVWNTRNDDEGEWLTVRYGKGLLRYIEVERYSKAVKPCEQTKEEEDGLGTSYTLNQYRFGYRFFYWD